MSRAFVSLPFTGADGRSRTGICWLDTGGGQLIMRRAFARELGLRQTGQAVIENGARLIPVDPPIVAAGDVNVPVANGDAMMLDSDRMISGVEADALFPVRLLRDHSVSFDYPNRRFGIDAETAPPSALPIEIASHSGFARVPVTIGGKRVYLLLDSGASCTMLSQTFIDELRVNHPHWRAVRGAYDDANMLGGTFEANAQELLLPSLEIGGITVPNVAAVSRPPGTFEHWMSTLVSGPIVGSLGGNVLRRFHLTIDYPNSRLALELADRRSALHPLSLVALTVTPNPDGTYGIAQILENPAYAAVRSKLLGAQLVAVDGRPVNSRRISDVHAMLRGIPKTLKRITIARAGRTHSYDLPVVVLWDGV